MKRSDGGSAFPEVCAHPDGPMSIGGMSLRDYFAAAALTGLLAAGRTSNDQGWVQKEAFDYADAMLKTRDK